MQAFKLKPEYEGFSGGTIKVDMAGHAFEVGKALEDGDGMIVLDDPAFAAVLASYDPLEVVPENEIPEGVEPVSIPGLEEDPTRGAPMPWTPQAPAGVVPAEMMPPVEHADEPDTPEEAVAAGEAVSGLESGESGNSITGGDSGITFSSFGKSGDATNDQSDE